MATGQPEGAYHQFAQQYRDILASHGIELELLNTAGSIENLKLLQADAQGVMEQEVTKVSVLCRRVVSSARAYQPCSEKATPDTKAAEILTMRIEVLHR
jgi:hypothetical protein